MAKKKQLAHRASGWNTFNQCADWLKMVVEKRSQNSIEIFIEFTWYDWAHINANDETFANMFGLAISIGDIWFQFWPYMWHSQRTIRKSEHHSITLDNTKLAEVWMQFDGFRIISVNL